MLLMELVAAGSDFFVAFPLFMTNYTSIYAVISTGYKVVKSICLVQLFKLNTHPTSLDTRRIHTWAVSDSSSRPATAQSGSCTVDASLARNGRLRPVLGI